MSGKYARWAKTSESGRSPSTRVLFVQNIRLKNYLSDTL